MKPNESSNKLVELILGEFYEEPPEGWFSKQKLVELSGLKKSRVGEVLSDAVRDGLVEVRTFKIKGHNPKPFYRFKEIRESGLSNSKNTKLHGRKRVLTSEPDWA